MSSKPSAGSSKKKTTKTMSTAARSSSGSSTELRSRASASRSSNASGSNKDMDPKSCNDSSRTNEEEVLTVEVAPSGRALGPVVASFPGGLPESLRVKPTTKTTRSIRNSLFSTADTPLFMLRCQDSKGDPKKKMASSASGRDPKTKMDHVTLVGNDSTCFYSSQSVQVPPRSSSADNSEQTPQPTRKARVSSSSTRLCVGIYDRLAGKLTIHPCAAEGSVFCLEQSVPAYLEETAKRTDDSEGALRDAATQYRTLFEDFGSAKKRKVIKSNEANRVTSLETVVGSGKAAVQAITQDNPNMSESTRRAIEQKRQEHLDLQQAEASGDKEVKPLAKEDNAAFIAWRRSFLPPFHLEESPHKVYRASEIAGSGAWGHLGRQLRACLESVANNSEENLVDALTAQPTSSSVTASSPPNKGKSMDRGWYPSIISLLRRLEKRYQDEGGADEGENEDEAGVLFQIRCAMLTNHWLQLYQNLRQKPHIKAPSLDGHFPPRFFGVPGAVCRRFLELFATPKLSDRSNSALGYVMTKATIDKCRVHLLLLHLMAVGGKSMTSAGFDMADLAADMQVEAKEAAQALRLAGCTVTQQRGGGSSRSWTVTLKAPLVFPPFSTGKTRGGSGRR